MEQEMEARRELIRVLSLKAFKDMQPSFNLLADAWTQFAQYMNAVMVPAIKSFGELYASLPDNLSREIEIPRH